MSTTSTMPTGPAVTARTRRPGAVAVLLAVLAFTLAIDPAGRAAHGQIPGLGQPLPAPPEQTFGDSRDRVAVQVEPAAPRVAVGGDLPVAIVLDHEPGWHVWTVRGQTIDGAAEFEYAQRTAVRFEVPEGSGLTVHEGFIQWPEPHLVEADVGDGPAKYAVYEGRAVAYVPITVAPDAAPGPRTIRVSIDLQACDDTQCDMPATVERTLRFEVVDLGALAETPPDVEPDPDFAGFPVDVFGRIRAGERAPEVVPFDFFGLAFDLDVSSSLGYGLLLLIAAMGGFLLNLTPCVLPVIPIKIMGLSQAAGGRARTLALGLAMTCGVIAFWIGLGLPIVFASGFTATNQLFQYPAFTIGVGVFIALMAIGMCGLFSIKLPTAVYAVNPSHESLGGSFLFGIMTAVLSTPCTAPFMGAALAWAAKQHATTALTVFAVIGAGMALPYLVLSAFPALAQRMPRTGPASELIKQVMGLLMLAAATFFIGSGLSGLLASPPDPPSRLYWWVVAAAGIAAGGWLAIRSIQLSRPTPDGVSRRTPGVIAAGVGVVILAVSAAVGLTQTARGPIDWIYYTPDRFADAQADGKVVVMEFTAEWCLNCKAMEASVLHSRSVASLLAEADIAPIKVDITGRNEDGNAMLKATDRVTIPWLVVFAPDGEAVFKGDSYTIDQVVRAVESARGSARRAGTAPLASGG